MSKAHTEAQSVIADTQLALALCTLLLEQPHVRLTDGTLRAVYRPALTWLAHALQQCSEATGSTSFSAKRSHGPAIFRSKRTGQKDNTQEQQQAPASETNDTAVLDATFAQEVMTYLRPVLLRAMQRIGGDVTRLCVLTQGGYESVFLPFLHDLAAEATTSHTNHDTTCAISEEQWRVLEEMLEMLTPQVHTNTPDTQTTTTNTIIVAPMMEAWQPPTSCLARQPLRCAHVMQLVQVCAQCLSQASHDIPTTTTTNNKASEGAVQGWQCRVDSVHALRVLTFILRAAPVIIFDEHHYNYNDSDDEEDEGKREKATRMTFYEFMTTLLSTFPLEQLWPLLASDESVKEEASHMNTFLLSRTRSGEAQSNVFGMSGGLYARYAFGFLAELVHTAIAQTQALCASYADGDVKLRQTLVKQCLLLMARLLTQSTFSTKDEESVTREMGASHITDTVAELLRVLSPLLTRRRKRGNAHKASSQLVNTKEGDDEQQQGFLLHIPLVALLVRMEEAEYSAALRYTSAVDLCRTILLSFDIQSQMRCLAQLMQLLVDPHAALGHHTNDAEEEEEAVVHVLRRLLKPNQVINRQETILNLINTTVKASAFLSKFVALQYHSKSTLVEDKGEEEEEKEVRHVAPVVPPTRADTSDGCMQLLVSALELYTHYTDLDTNTANDLPTQETITTKKKSSKGDEATVLYGEQKAYVMLLELLSGNTLACVLAGINESTFVQCLLQLLRDERPSLRRKGLEVLLDRLHHSLPTVEHTISDADLARHRAALRDPKKKLTLMDLVKLKARPLTTKRSLHLFPLLTTHVQESLQYLLAARNTSTDALVDAEVERHGVTAQLAIACIEELVRIVACGGSMQAEKTLLNVSRSKRLTEALLAKLFGNKARVQAVHACLTSWCEQDLPNMLKALTTTSHNTSESNGTDIRMTAMMVVMSAMFTALGTAVQAMGEAFAAPHSQTLLRILVASATQAVITLPFTVATSTAGSLLRHTTLSCLIRAFPACWQFSQPYLPHLLFTITHTITVQDTNTSYLATELLTVLEALLEPQLLLEASIECLRGVRQDPTDQTNEKNKKKGDIEARRGQSSVLRIRLETHSLELFYGCVLRRVQNLKPEELTALTVLIGGSTARDNFWLASLQMVAHATSTPTSTTVMPILEAFTAFFVKFRPQQCTALLQLITEWAFSESDTPNNNDKIMESNEASAHRHRQRVKKSVEAEYDREDAEEEDSDTVNEEGVVSRTRLQSWLLFYVVYNHLLEKLGPIMDFAYPVALPHLLRLLTEYCADSSPTRRVPFVALVTLCLEQALDAMRRMAVAQTPGPEYDYSIPLDIYFATAEVFNGAMPALVHQLTNTVYLQDSTQDYATRAEQSVIPAIRAFFACLNSNKLQGKTQSELLRGLRHPSRHVRRLTLRCLDGIYADGGDELAARLMAEMLPSVVELTEDRDDAVVEEARTLCVNLSRMTGQDVLHAMSN